MVFDFCYIGTNYNLGVSFLFEIELESSSGLKETENRKNQLVLLFCKNTE